MTSQSFYLHIFQARMSIVRAMEEISSASFDKHGHDQLIIATMNYLRLSEQRLKQIMEKETS